MLKRSLLILLTVVCSVALTHAADDSQQGSAHLSGTKEVSKQIPPADLKPTMGAWTQVSTLKQNATVPHKRVKRTSAASLSGQTVYGAEFYQSASDVRTLNDAGLVAFSYEASTATVKGLGLYFNSFTMDYDLADGTVSVTPQKIFTHTTYGDVYICPIDWDNKKYSTTSPLTGTIDEKGNVTFGSWGLFIVSGDYANSSFLATKGSTVCAANGQMTNIFRDNPDSTEVYPIYVEQQYDNQIGIVNFGGNGPEVSVYVNPDQTVEITPQHIYTNSTYGEFVCKPADWSGSGILSGSINGTSTPSLISLGNWCITNRAYSNLLAYAYASSKIELTDFTLTYPKQRELTWEGDGSTASPYVITSAEQLQEFAEAVTYGNDFAGKHITLANDLDLSTITSAYRSIGRSDQSPFKGIFDGAGHTLRNLTIIYGQESNAGIFGYVGQGGIVKNFTVDHLTLTSAGQYAGGAIAQACGAEISNIKVTHANITHTNSWGGGIVGEMMLGSVTDCHFQGTISGAGATGGIVGFLRGANVSKCTANAGMSYAEYYDRFYRSVGGVVGYTIDKRNNNDELIESYVTDSYFTGTMIDNDGHGQMGGVVGNVNGGHLARCFNAAPISTVTTDELNGCAGGLVAMLRGGTVKDCFSANEVVARMGTKQVAGLIGYTLMDTKTTSEIENCYNAGEVIVSGGYASNNVYGVRFYPSTFKNVYYDKQMSPSAMPDSLTWMGMTTTEMTTSHGLEGFSADVWTFVDGFYPVLTQFKDEPAALMATAPLFLANNENVNKVKSNFQGAVKDGLLWRIYSEQGFITDGTSLSVGEDNATFTLKNVTANEIIGVTADDNNYKLFSIATVSPEGFVGSGTAASPYLIQDKEDLITLNNSVKDGQSFEDEYFAQTADIDLDYADDFKGVGDDYNKNHLFNGIYDGKGYTIRRMKIDGVTYGSDGKAVYGSSRRVAGLFGYAGAKSIIKNVNIAADCQIEVYSLAGGVVGSTQGTVQNCRNYANITAITDNAGGIAGEVAATGMLSGCYNSGTITAGKSKAGGIAGALNGTLEYCQNDGEVRAIYLTPSAAATALNSVGGVAGTASGTSVVIRGSVNTGYVHSLKDVGGISSTVSRAKEISGNLNYGIVEYHSTNGTIGAVTGTTYNSDAVTNNYFDAQIGFQNAAALVAMNGCTGLTTSTLTNGTELAGLSTTYFNYTNGMYPVLKAFAKEAAAVAHRQMIVAFNEADNCDNMEQSATLANIEGLTWSLQKATDFTIDNSQLSVAIKADTVSLRDTLTLSLNGYDKMIPLRAVPILFEGKGTLAEPYLIKTVADMQTLGRFSTNELCSFAGKHFQLANDLDFAEQEFYPVAQSTTMFEAEFDGNGKKLTNVNYATEKGENAAIFSNVGKTGYIHDFTLASGSISGYRYVGGVANAVYGTVERCTNGATLSTEKNPYAGGIAAYVYSGGAIIGCTNEGIIAPAGGSGGGIATIANSGSLIKDCINKAEIKDLGTMAGIVVSSYGRVENCINQGIISGTTSLGGIASKAYAADSIINCINEAPITGTGNYIAGIAAQTNGGDEPTVFINCVNTAPIQGKDNVAGIVGYARVGVAFYDCRNMGTITASGTSSGGFLGTGYASSSNTSDGLAERCYNTGKVVATGKDVGGFVGNAAAKFSFVDCYNTGDITSSGNGIGGFSGTLKGSTQNCYNSGSVVSSGYGVGGFAGIAQGANITGCFNVGDVTSTSTTTDGSHGNAGGLIGEGYGVLRSSFNMGHVEATAYAAGLLGMATSTSAKIFCCYNAGEVSASTENTIDAIQMAGKKYMATVDSVFFDKEFCTNVPDTASLGLTTKQLLKTDLGEDFVYRSAYYPLPSAFETNDTALAYAAAYELADDDTSQDIKSEFVIAVPTGLEWTSSDNLIINGDRVVSTTEGEATLTKIFGSWMRTFNLRTAVATDINAMSIGEDNASTFYYNINGTRASRPHTGNIIIEKIRKADGSTITRKAIHRK